MKRVRVSARRVLSLSEDELWETIVGDNLLVVCDDGEVPMTSTELIISAYAWSAHRNYKSLPLTTDCVLQPNEPRGRGMHIKIMQRVFSIAMDVLLGSHRIDVDPPTLAYELIEGFTKRNNDLYNRGYLEFHKFITTSCIRDQMELYDHPELIELRESLFDTELNEGVVNECLNKAIKLLNSDLRNSDGSVNQLSWMARRKLIKDKQLAHSVFIRGYVTDTNDMVIDYPILDCYLTGMRTVRSFNIMSRENAVSVSAQQDELRRASTDSRRVTYVSSYKRGVVFGDCGSKDYIKYHVENQKFLNILAGSYIVNPEYSDRLIRVERSHKHLIGKTVDVRMQMTCRVKDPTISCMVCSGSTGETCPKGVNMGSDLARAIHQIIIQLQLSKKHFLDSAAGTGGGVTPAWNKIFKENNKRQVFIREGIFKGAVKVTISIPQMGRLNQIFDVDNVDKLILDRVSDIRWAHIVITKKRSVIDEKTSALKGDVKCMLSYQALRFLKKKYDEGDDRITPVESGATLDFTGFNFKKHHLFRRPNLAGDQSAIAKYLLSLYEHGGEGSILETLHDIVKVTAELGSDVSLGAIETILSSYICKDGSYDLARGFENTHHGTALGVLSNRSLSALLLLKDQKTTIGTAKQFLLKHRDNNMLDCVFKPAEILSENNIPATVVEDNMRKEWNV